MRLPFDIGNLKFDFANQWKTRKSNKTWMFIAAYVEKRLHEKHSALENCDSNEFLKHQGAVSELRSLQKILDMENIEPTLKEVVEFSNK